MYNNSRVAKSIRLALTFCAASVMAAPAFAEENAEKRSDEEIIEVTGSRIARSELSQPTPVITLEAKDIAKFGTPDLGSILAELPAIGATDTLIGNNNSNLSAGLSAVDLRRLGSKRTLVLVNGKRHVAGSPGSATVDTSTIPSALIERIEIITGGASAIYGSDAVSGVVNIIMKKDYEGLQFSANAASSTEGVGAKNHTLSLLAGSEIADGKGNINFYATLDYFKETMKRDIQQFASWGTVANPANTGEEDGIADRFRVPHVGSEMIHANGVISPFGGGVGRYTFDNAGNPVLQTERDLTNSFAFGSFPNGCDYCFFSEDYENYQPGVNKVNIGSSFNYEIAEDTSFYSEFKYVRSDITQQYQPSFRFGNISINVQDNPYLDADLRQQLLDNGDTTVSMAKFFDELGNRSADNRRELFRYVGGIEGAFAISETDFDYEIFYGYGETTNTRKTLNDLIPDNLVAAIDAVIDPDSGEIACRSQVASAQPDDYKDPASVNGANCVPFNPFGQSSSAEARDWVSADVTREDKITQEYIGASMTFDTAEFLELQGGGVGIAMGIEYREETSETTTDEFTKRGFLTSAATPDESGKYDVTEYFIEVSLPLLVDAEFAKELTVDGAFRSADYSHAGTTEAWKVGVMYAPINDVRVRATYGESVRAPNITEAFSPQSPGFARVSDPCDSDNIGDDPDRAANCAALGIPAGFQANDNVSVDLLSGGNENLKPEESSSYTVGVVWTPEFLSDFSLTVDFYDIEIEDAIIEVDAQDIADNCVDATGGLDSGYCSQVDRNPTTNDIELVRSGFLNASALNTQGIEIQSRYKTDLQYFDLPGELTVNLLVNKLLELEEFEFQDRPDEINVEDGEVGDPELQTRFTATWELDDLSVSWITRYVDRSATFDVSPGGDIEEDFSPAYVGSIVTHDLSVNYIVSENVFFNAGVRNLGNKLAPGYTENPIYDLIGRRVFAGITVEM